MAIPWLLALKAIPWDTILANAPTILRSADSLLSNTRTPAKPGTAARDALAALGDRIAVLEQRDRETADLLKKTTDQIAALTTATEVIEARLRWLTVLGIAASIVALAALAVAFLVR